MEIKNIADQCVYEIHNTTTIEDLNWVCEQYKDMVADWVIESAYDEQFLRLCEKMCGLNADNLFDQCDTLAELEYEFNRKVDYAKRHIRKAHMRIPYLTVFGKGYLTRREELEWAALDI